MAKAEVRCVCETCGETFKKSSDQCNRSAADKWEEWAKDHYTMCPKCYREYVRECEEAKKAKETEEGKRLAFEKPQMIGSEEQCKWAYWILKKWIENYNSLRSSKITYCTEHDVDEEKAAKLFDKIKKADAVATWIIENHSNAYWWIDNRENLDNKWYENFVEEYENYIAVPAEVREQEAELRKAVEEEATVIPQKHEHVGVVIINVTKNKVIAKYAKDDDFRKIIKGLGYRWDMDAREWFKEISETTGAAKERAAELGNKLLNGGFAVCIYDPATRKDAIEGNYKPEHRRWVWAHKDGKHFILKWEYNDNIYYAAKRLPSAKYSSPYIVVNKTEYDAVVGFAERYDFRWTSGAKELLKGVQDALIIPAAAKEAAYEEHPVKDILNSSREVLEDLIDD